MSTEQIEEFGKLMRRSVPAMKILALALSHVGTAAVAYKIAMQKMEAKYAELADAEISEARAHYETRLKDALKPQYATPGEAVQALIGPVKEDMLVDAMSNLALYQGHRGGGDERVSYDKIVRPGDAVIETSVELVEVSKNIFTDAEPVELDMDVELKLRDPDAPYILTQEEFMAAEPGYPQVSLTYFVGDNTLADESDAPINDIEFTVGSKNLGRFGHGSKDSNVVYVRNVRLELDYEISRSFGKYAVEVAGLDDEDLEHSAYSRMPRRRQHLQDD